MTQKSQQGWEKTLSENDDIKNVSISLSNFIYTKIIDDFWLKNRWKPIVIWMTTGH